MQTRNGMRTRPVRHLARALCLVALGVSEGTAQSNPTDDLVGLWTAKRRFGPDARGPLILERRDGAFAADMMGSTFAGRLEGQEVVLELPSHQGTIRGKLERDGTFVGHWVQPPSMAQMTGASYASPVRLESEGRNRWSGLLHPFEDVFTFHLLVTKRADGSFGAVLRNPDRDFGAWLGVDRIVREDSVVRLIGRRSTETKDRELARGTYAREPEVMTLSFPFRGGSYDFRRDDDRSAFYPRGKHPDRYVYRPPAERPDGWPTATLEVARIDRPAIESLVQMLVDMPMDSLNAPQIHGLLIARHGKLVLEEYFHGEHRDKLHETRSAAKSITAVLVGAAIQAQAPLSLSTPVYAAMHGGSFPPDIEPDKRAMTLEHLLTMSSGFFCDDTNPEAPGNEERMLEQTSEPDYYRYSLQVPLDRRPGETAIYCSADPNLALGMLGRVTGESPMLVFDRLLGGPLGIRRYGWPLDPAHQPYGGGSVQILPRDFLKLGQLMLDDGTWQGRRVLGRDFVQRASAPQYHLRNIYYGYLWWGIDYPYKDRTVYAFFAGGAGGQGVTVIRDLDLVVAVFAANYSSRGGRFLQQELLPRFILPAVRERGDDPNAPVTPRDYKSPYGRAPAAGRVSGNRSGS